MSSNLKTIDITHENIKQEKQNWVKRDPLSRSQRPHERFISPYELTRDEMASALAAKTISPSLVSSVLAFIELILIFLSGKICLVFFGFEAQQSLTYASISFFSILLLYMICGQVLSIYSLHIVRDTPQQFMRMILSWLTAFGILYLVAKMFPNLNVFNDQWKAVWFLSVLFIISCLRLMVGKLVQQWTSDGLLERRAVIIGGGKEAEELISKLEGQKNNDIRICGIFDDRTDERSPQNVAGYPKLGTIPELLDFARSARLDMLIVSLPLTAGGRVREMLKKLWVLPVDIRLSAHSNKLAVGNQNYAYIGTMPFVKLADRPITGWRFIKKRLFDFVLSAFFLVLFLPLMLITALAIKLDSRGPVFFCQKRHGFNNEVINVWKFRSMYHDQRDEAAQVVVTKGDARVTRVGAFIRKTSLDELPQLWNVLKGELSLVGPRPHAVHAHLKNQPWNDVVDGYFARHRVKPGVTGWAQIHGLRGEIDNAEKIKKRTNYDLYYIENWSLSFDLYILAMTPFKLLDTKNAY